LSLSESRDQFLQSPHRPYTIEPMVETDLTEVVEIEEITGLNRWGYDAYRRELLKNPDAVMLVARNLGPGRGVVGFFAGWTVEDELHVNNIASHPSYRKMGIGESLMEAGLEAGRRNGVVYVILEVRASNEAAQSLYRKMGFSYVGRRRDYYRFPTEDAFVMKLVME
jgi:[ribosomal protein S18]-alanine N-acetyltransferase